MSFRPHSHWAKSKCCIRHAAYFLRYQHIRWPFSWECHPNIAILNLSLGILCEAVKCVHLSVVSHHFSSKKKEKNKYMINNQHKLKHGVKNTFADTFTIALLGWCFEFKSKRPAHSFHFDSYFLRKFQVIFDFFPLACCPLLVVLFISPGIRLCFLSKKYIYIYISSSIHILFVEYRNFYHIISRIKRLINEIVAVLCWAQILRVSIYNWLCVHH